MMVKTLPVVPMAPGGLSNRPVKSPSYSSSESATTSMPEIGHIRKTGSAVVQKSATEGAGRSNPRAALR